MGLHKPPSNLTSLASFFLLLFITIHQSLSARTLGALPSPPQPPPKNHHHHHKTMSFYMPNVLNLNLQHPSTTTPPTKVNGQTIPFSKPLGFFPPIGGIPIPDSSSIPRQTSGLYGFGTGISFPILEDELEFDQLRFFGVHRADVNHESHVAIIGGTGKYDGANGYATLKVVKLHQKAIKEDGETNDFLLVDVYLG
ncbi:hypothetical protein Lser_V15G36302 [Lactuca serriola]